MPKPREKSGFRCRPPEAYFKFLFRTSKNMYLKKHPFSGCTFTGEI